MKEQAKPTIIGFKALEDCTLESHNYEYDEVISIADHGEDADWPGIVFFEKHPSLFEPIYESIFWSIWDDEKMQELSIRQNLEDIANLPYDTSSKEHAQLIVTAVNACKQINPSNPIAVAEGVESLVKSMLSLQRYSIDGNDEGGSTTEYDASGDWVMWEDVRAALSKLQVVAKEEGE